MPDRLYNPYQVADLLGVTPTEVAQWIQKGSLSIQRLPNGPVRIKERALVQFLRASGIDIKDLMAKITQREAQQAKQQARQPHDSQGAGPDVSRASLVRIESDAAPRDDVSPAAHLLRPAAPPEVGESNNANQPAIAAAAEMVVDDAPPLPGIDVPAKEDNLLSRLADLLAAGRVQEVIIDDANGDWPAARIDGVVSALGGNGEGESAASVMEQVRRTASLEFTRAAQEASFRTEASGRLVNIFVRTCPTAAGRRMVLASEPAAASWSALATLAVPAQQAELLRRMLSRRCGLIMLGGPAGSGTASTACRLAHEARAGRDVLAVSRSAAALAEGLTQLSLSPEMDYAAALRSAISQQADVLVLDDLRRRSEYELALQAASQGRLVLACVRCNLADTFELLCDAQPDGWELASCLLGFIDQRMVRRLCPHCSIDTGAKEEHLAALGLAKVKLGFTVRQAVGCRRCLQRGYLGQTPLLSVVHFAEQVSREIRCGGDLKAIERAAQQAGTRTLVQAGLDRARALEVDLAELVRVLT